MKNKIFIAFFIITTAYILLNIYSYYKLRDCCIVDALVPFIEVTDGNIKREYVVASYYSSNDDSLLLCHYVLKNKYEYIFYETKYLSSDLTLVSDKIADNEYAVFQDIQGISDTLSINNKFISVNAIFSKISVLNTNKINKRVYLLKNTYLIKKKNFSFFDRLTPGPAIEYFTNR
jgi:hypothetical protein